MRPNVLPPDLWLSRKDISLLFCRVSLAVQRELQDEDLRALWLWGPEFGANGRLPKSARAFPHARHLLRQCHGGLLDAAWTSQLQGTPVLPASWRVQEAQWVGEHQPYYWVSETCHWDQLSPTVFFYNPYLGPLLHFHPPVPLNASTVPVWSQHCGVQNWHNPL